MSPTLSELLGDLVPVPPAYAAELRIAAVSALEGGRAAMAYYSVDAVEVRDKGEDNPVTAADHAANRAILACLREQAPGERVLSEEVFPAPGSPSELVHPLSSLADSPPDLAHQPPPRLWVVDPLDGTKEFLARNGEFSTMVGLAERGRAILGAVYQPDPDRLYLGLVGAGAWAVADPRHRPAVRRLKLAEEPVNALRLLLSRSHGDPAIDRLVARLGDVSVARSGSAGIKCARIALGEADLYVHPVPYLKEWDTCAPEAVLRGAGGRVTDCGGGRLEYGKPDPRQPRGIFAGRPEAWRHAEAVVREVAADLLERA